MRMLLKAIKTGLTGLKEGCESCFKMACMPLSREGNKNTEKEKDCICSIFQKTEMLQVRSFLYPQAMSQAAILAVKLDGCSGQNHMQ